MRFLGEKWIFAVKKCEFAGKFAKFCNCWSNVDNFLKEVVVILNPILEGSFWAISNPMFANQNWFCSISQALPYLRSFGVGFPTFAPLQIWYSSNNPLQINDVDRISVKVGKKSAKYFRKNNISDKYCQLLNMSVNVFCINISQKTLQTSNSLVKSVPIQPNTS